MRKTKMEKGITLLALIITIVVLLILASVTIGAIKNSGIIGHAKDASSEYTIEQEKEQIQLALSEWQIQKNIPDNTETFTSVITSALRKNKEVTSVDVNDNGQLIITFKTGNTYNVTEDGNITKIEKENGESGNSEEIEISSEIDLGAISYMYNTMYNLAQPEVIAKEYVDDANNDRISDINNNLGAYIYNSDFDILKTFFSEKMPTDGNIEATITHFDGSEQQIVLTTKDNKIWIYEDSETKIGNIVDGLKIWFCPNSENVEDKGKGEYNITSSNDYHFLHVNGNRAVPFESLTMLGKTIEFPVNCQACMMVEWDEHGYPSVPMYSDKENISKIIVNYSNNTSAEYTKNDIFDYTQYFGDNCYYSSKENPILCVMGAMAIHMPCAGLKMQITSIIVEENGISTKYNVTDNTDIMHLTPGD